MRTALTALLCCIPLTSVAADAPERNEFAYETAINLHESSAIYRVPLTFAVYRAVTRPDLGDLRVYNASGEMVPHALRRPRLEPATTRVPLPLFPLPPETTRTTGDLSVHVNIDAGGSIVDMASTSARAEGQRAYILDASGVQHPIGALEVTWADDNIGAVRHLRIEASDDLRSWRLIGQGAVAKIERDGQLLERRRVEFPARKAKYLHLSWAEPSLSAEIRAVIAEYSVSPAPERDWFRATPKTLEESHEQRYVLNGQALVDRARVVLPSNSVARVAVLYRNEDGDRWLHAGAKTVYSITGDNGTVEDRELRLARPTSARQWLLRFNEPVGIDVGLELGWLPHEVVFLARGERPFHLAYGLGGLAPSDSGMHELIRLSMRENSGVDIGRASLGSTRELRGEKARRPGWSLATWKHWLLWTVLVAGVGALCWLALRLAGQIRAAGGS